MASVQYLFTFSKTFNKELVTAQVRLNEITESRRVYAIIIQKTWRRYCAQKKYKLTRSAILTAQSFYRGWVVRKNRREYEEQHAVDLENQRQRWAATKIQAWFRGMQDRKLIRFKYGGLPTDLIKERKRVQAASEQMANELRKIFDENQRIEKQRLEASQQRESLVILYKCHHLLRTYSSEGIYSCHGSKNLSLIESLMNALPCRDYMDNVHQLYNELMKIKRKTESKKKKSARQICSDETIKRIELLPRSQTHILPTKVPHKKPFILHSKIKREPYIPSVVNYNERTIRVDPTLRQKEKGFKLSPAKDLQPQTEPYYVDFWEKEIFSKTKDTCI